jgi:hypothetical protein
MCWLCEYNKETEAKNLTKFLSDNVANMGTDQIAQCIHERLEEIDPNGEGHSFEQVKEHILLHVVIPNVKIAGIIRSLTGLMDRLETMLMNTAEDDTVVIDAKNVGIYLKVVNEVMQIYKTGNSNRLMFSDTVGGKNSNGADDAST